MTEGVGIRVEAGVLVATLDRPSARNALDAAMVARLDVAMDEAETNPAIRAFCLRATGTVFCAGVDLGHAGTMAADAEDRGVEDTVRLTGMMLRLSRLSRPTLALVQGPAFGAGIGLLVACDIVLATPDASFATTQVRHGLVPGFVAPFLAHAIGTRRAQRYLLTGERFGAEEAREIGLVHEVLAADALYARAQAILAALRRGGPGSLAGTKRILAEHGPPGLHDDAVRALAEFVAAHRRSPEATEGMSAFREKRRPAWCAEEG